MEQASPELLPVLLCALAVLGQGPARQLASACSDALQQARFPASAGDRGYL